MRTKKEHYEEYMNYDNETYEEYDYDNHDDYVEDSYYDDYNEQYEEPYHYEPMEETSVKRARYSAKLDRFLTNGIIVTTVLLIAVLLIAFLV